MRMIEATKICLGKYVTFSGRASRPEYWWFVLLAFLVTLVLSVIDAFLFGTDPETGESTPILSSIFQLAIFLPALSAGWRRMHDSGRPGWYLLVPTGISALFILAIFFGIFAFGFAETHGADEDALRGAATLMGGAALIVFLVVQLALLVLLIWWLTRPSDEAANAFGPRPTF